jgi:hypothetical protein
VLSARWRIPHPTDLNELEAMLEAYAPPHAQRDPVA